MGTFTCCFSYTGKTITFDMLLSDHMDGAYQDNLDGIRQLFLSQKSK